MPLMQIAPQIKQYMPTKGAPAASSFTPPCPVAGKGNGEYVRLSSQEKWHKLVCNVSRPKNNMTWSSDAVYLYMSEQFSSLTGRGADGGYNPIVNFATGQWFITAYESTDKTTACHTGVRIWSFNLENLLEFV